MPLTGDIRAYFYIFVFSASSPGDGFGSSPNITANENKWTVPLGGGFAKAMRGGRQPVKLATAGYYNTVRPNAESDP